MLTSEFVNTHIAIRSLDISSPGENIGRVWQRGDFGGREVWQVRDERGCYVWRRHYETFAKFVFNIAVGLHDSDGVEPSRPYYMLLVVEVCQPDRIRCRFAYRPPAGHTG